MPTNSNFADGPLLVTLDGSDLAEQALPYAVALASALSKPLFLFTASYSPEIWNHVPSGDYESTAREFCLSYLDRTKQKVSGAEVRTLVRSGFARDEILRAADEVHASMIVTASHGRSGLSRWAYGSVASHLAHDSHLPLLIVGRGALARAKEAVGLKRIAVPLDGSELAEHALEPALRLATALGADVTLVRAVPWAVEAYPYSLGMYVAELDDDMALSASTYLDTTRAGLGSSTTIDTVVLRGFVAECLRTFVDEHDVDLVVMTTHARSGFARAVLGSTADRMLQGRSPVLLIRPS
jgi:nucleotide-binding universal stress UspA family protein